MDGSLIREIRGTYSYKRLGLDTLTWVDDMDGDGYQEILLDARSAFFGVGYLQINPGGPTSASAIVSQNTVEYSPVVHAIGDQNGDGQEDLAPIESDVYGTYQLQFFSTADGSIFCTYSPPAGHHLDTFSRFTVGHFDDDGLLDICLMEDTTPGSGEMVVLSSQGGELTRLPFVSTAPHALAAGADLNGDGRSEVIIGLPSQTPGFGVLVGTAQVYGFNPFLLPSLSELSASAGGTLRWNMTFPVDAADQQYQLLASAAGTQPTSLPGVTILLTLDSWLASTFLGDYPPVLQGGAGTLDATAQATATLNLPAGMLPAGMVGATFHFAAVSRSDPWNYTYASVSQPLTFVPEGGPDWLRSAIPRPHESDQKVLISASRG